MMQLESLPSMVAGVWSDDSNMQLEATTQFRKLLSIGRVVNLCLVPVTFLCVRLTYILYFNYQSVALQLKKLYDLELFLALLSFL